METTPTTPTTARALRRLVKAAKTTPALKRLEGTTARHYQNGTITVGELKALDNLIMVRLARLTV